MQMASTQAVRGLGQAQPTEMGPIAQAIERVQSRAEGVVDRLNLLLARLAPVLRQQTKIAGGGHADGKAPVLSSPAAQEINRAHEVLLAAEEILADILARLEL
jgi:hypothetical protein